MRPTSGRPLFACSERASHSREIHKPASVQLDRLRERGSDCRSRRESERLAGGGASGVGPRRCRFGSVRLRRAGAPTPGRGWARSWVSHGNAIPLPPQCWACSRAMPGRVCSRAQSRYSSATMAAQVIGTAPASGRRGGSRPRRNGRDPGRAGDRRGARRARAALAGTGRARRRARRRQGRRRPRRGRRAPRRGGCGRRSGGRAARRSRRSRARPGARAGSHRARTARGRREGARGRRARAGRR
jgi:hypothetical protein